MPVQLNPMTRRQFLGRSMVSGLGIALFSKLTAGERRIDSNCWIFISDTHVSGDRQASLHGGNMVAHLQTAVNEVLEMQYSPAGIFFCGDLAFKTGARDDYETFTEIIQPLRSARIPVCLTLGNHDNRDAFLSVLPEYQFRNRMVLYRQCSIVRSELVNWFVLDSLVGDQRVPGMLGVEQLEWLTTALDENCDRPAIVIVHHNPAWVADHFGLEDTHALWSILRPRRHVKAYIHGHTHEWSIGKDSSGIHLINLPPTAYLFKEGHPLGWVLVDVSNNGIRVELHNLDQKNSNRRQVCDLNWRA